MISLEREKLLSELEQKIGYSFRSRALLDRSLTHRSFANERVAEKCQHNEAMEFLGDSVLGFIVSAWLLERFPDLSEGKLSKMKSYLVSEASLVELAEELDLGRYILLNRGEEKTGGRRKRALLADAYEALIGAVYIDGGVEVAGRFLRREMRQKLAAIDPSAMIGADYKSALQERLQALGGPSPEYLVVEVLGPDHRRTFRIELRVGGRSMAIGEGHTIKIAQQEAARAVLTSSSELLENIAAEIYHARFAEVIEGDYIADDLASQSDTIETEAALDGEYLSTTFEESANAERAVEAEEEGRAEIDDAPATDEAEAEEETRTVATDAGV
jgi:ribonuclease III